MTVALAATWVFAVLLAVAGLRKVVSPAATRAALQGARLPSDHRLVRLLGAGEVLLAAAVLAVGGAIPSIVLALVYAAFAVFAHLQSRRGAGCGCFGDSETPATSLHVVLNAVGAVAGGVAAAGAAPTLAAALRGAGPVEWAITLAAVALGAVTVSLAYTALPELAVAAALGADGEAA